MGDELDEPIAKGLLGVKREAREKAVKVTSRAIKVGGATAGSKKKPAKATPRALMARGAPAAGSMKKRAKKSQETYKRYIYKVLKQIDPNIGASSGAMRILNSLMEDIFEKVAMEASRLARSVKKLTIGYREIHSAVLLVLPGDLGGLAALQGTKAVKRFCKPGAV